MFLSKASKFGLYALVTMAGKPGERVSVSSIAQRYGISDNHVAKVLQQLTRSGLVTSMRGARGGYALARDARDITMADVVEILEGPLPEPSTCQSCPFREELPFCSSDAMACNIHHVLHELDTQAVYTLKSVTIHSLVHKGRDLLRPEDSGPGPTGSTDH